MRIKQKVMFIVCLMVLGGCGVSSDHEAALPAENAEEADGGESRGIYASIDSSEEEGSTDAEEERAEEFEDKVSSEVSENEEQMNEDKDQVQVNEDQVNEDKEEEDKEVHESDAEELLDAFLASEIPAIDEIYGGSLIVYDRLPHDEDDWECYSVGERIDLDNDGENEQVVNGPYGGIYLDARDRKVYVLAEGDGTAQMLSYVYYDNATWIVYRDTTHAGREFFWLSKYDGGENLVDEFTLGAEYWESPDDHYDENSEFTYRDEKISMEKYEELKKEIFNF